MDIVRLEYGYDRSGNRLYRRDEVARSQTPLAKYDELYGYDGLNRLTSFDRGELNVGNTGLTGSPTLTQDWTLDGTGNWSGFSQTVQSPLTQTRTHNPVNEITGIGETVGTAWPDPAYDANGNATSFPKPASLGNGMTATYDAWNRLVKVADSGGTVAEYRYDGLNRRTEKIAGGTTRHDYFSDQWQTLEERTGSSTSADRQFVWGQRYVDDLVLRDRTSERLYALQDALFNVVALTSNTGAVQERFAYQPYGQSESLDPDFSTYTGTDLNWEYRFTGRELDFESGLQINRNRYLHLQLGRWITRDELEYIGGSNLYVANDVLNGTDSHGRVVIRHDGKRAYLQQRECDSDFSSWSIAWIFSNEAPQPTCSGYFVQHVAVTCTISPCDNRASQVYQYWEAWRVENGAQEVKDQAVYNAADLGRKNYLGVYIQEGDVRFFCDEDVHAEIQQWKYKQMHGESPCGTSANGLPSTETEPAFWEDSESHIGATASRLFAAYLACCSGCEDSMGAYADPAPSPRR